MIAAEVAPTLNAHFGAKQGLEDQHIDGGGDCSLPSVAMCLNAGAMGRRDAETETETLIPTTGAGFDVAHSLRADDTANIRAASGGSSRSYVSEAWAVRRLTPVECERLQGFPDNFTMIPWRKKAAEDCPDGPRYKALGNSMAVPCMRWIGERIRLVDAMADLL